MKRKIKKLSMIVATTLFASALAMGAVEVFCNNNTQERIDKASRGLYNLACDGYVVVTRCFRLNYKNKVERGE